MTDWEWRPYQQTAIDTLLEGDGVGLLATALGGGKTAIAVEVVRRMNARVIMVTAPLNTHSGWRRHFNILMPELPVRTVEKGNEDALDKAKAGEPGVYIVGWEYGRGVVRYKKGPDGKRLLVKQGNKKVPVVDKVIREPLNWSKYPLDAVIVDETARQANRKASQTKTIHTSKGAPIKLALSATPAGNKIEGIWSTLHFLWPDRFKYFWPWVDAYLVKKPDPFAGMVIVGEKRAGIVAKSIPNFVRQTEEEIHSELPEVVTHHIEVSLTPAQRKVYRQFEEDALAWLEAYPVAAALPVTKRIRLLQTCLAVPSVVEGPNGEQTVTFKEGAKSSKIDAVLDIMADLPEDEKVLVWTHSKKIIPIVVDRLTRAGYATSVAVGGQSQTVRDAALEAFTQGDSQVLVATVPTLGEGTDGLQHVCATEIWLSLDESLTLNKQAMGRLRRPNQTRTINRFIIQATDTLETRKLGRLETTEVAMTAAGMF